MTRNKTRSLTFGLATIAMLIACRPVSVLAQTRTWTNANPGNFLTNSNWSGGVAPNGVGQSAVIGANPTAAGNFTLNGAQTLGTLDYSNNTGRQLAGTGTLTFQASSGNALFHTSGGGFLDLNVAGITLASTTEFRIEGHSAAVYSPISGSGGLMKTGGEAFVLGNANNSYTGLNTISYGWLYGSTIANNGTNSSFGRGSFSLDGGGFAYTGASASTNRTIALGTGGGEISVDNANTVLNWAGVISGNGPLTKYGPGTLQLNASNTNTGATNLNAGTLRLGASERITDGSAVAVSSVATFNLNDFGETIGSLAGAGNVMLGSGTLTTGGNNSSTTFSGVISGSGSLIKQGLGTMTLSGASTNTGNTLVNAGTLKIANGGVVNSATGYLGVYSGSSGTATVTGAGSKWQNSELNVGIQGTGTLNVENGGVVTSTTGYLGIYYGPSSTATVTGAGSRWQNAGILYVGLYGAGTLNVENGGVATSTTGYLGYNSGSNGTATVTGAGSRWQNAGNLYVGNGGNGTLNVFDGGKVDVGGTTKTYSGGTLTIDGGVLETGSLDRSLGSVNHYDGTIKVNGGAYIQSATTLLVQSKAANKTATLELAGNGPQSAISQVLVGNDSNTRGVLNITSGRTLTNSYGYLGYNPDSTGTATVTGAGSKWQTSVELFVGISGSGALNVENGGVVTNINGYLGYYSGSAGTATIKGSESKLQSSQHLWVGNSGAGEMNVENGGLVTNASGILGYESGSTGTATITGAGSKWQNSSDLYVAFSGVGTLNVENGGVVSNNDGYLGRSLGSTGTATVTGAGSKWQNSTALWVGYAGAATLNVENGGLVTSNNGGFLGVGSGAAGTAKVTGAGSQWQNNSSLLVGYYGGGTLNVENGGVVASREGYLGRYSGSNGTATVAGTGSKWLNSYDLYVGNYGAGTLNVENGGLVSSANGILGYDSGSAGTATVTGANTWWKNDNELTIAFSGAGALNVENGGGVSSFDGYLGRFVDSNGTAKVTGNGSSWFSNILRVGDSGTGTLNVENGGLVSGGTGIVGTYSGAIGTVTVTGAGSQLRFSDLYIGNSGRGTLNIENGGLVAAESLISPLTVFLGYDPGSIGAATVTGTGSQWQVGSLYVGYSGAGMLTIENGGVVEAGSLFAVGALGTITGNGGTIVGNVVNYGLIAPGSSLGVLTIDGDLASSGRIAFELAGISSGLFDQLVVSGTTNLGGTIEVGLFDGFSPTAGSSFKLLDFGDFADTGYSFDFTHAVLGGGLTWDTSTFALDGTISVVPEPSSLILALIASLASMAVWRKRKAASVY